MIRWTDDKRAELRSLWDEGLGKTEIARRMGASVNAIIGQSMRENLHFQGSRRVVLKDDHPSMRFGRTLFPSRVFAPDGNVLKPGSYSRKLGGIVAKGHWRGFPIFTLSLEERATCPRSCSVWSSCYGNHTQAAKRYRHGPELIASLRTELAALQARYPAGFVVRLHVLGDFYSVAYVVQWMKWLMEFPAMRVFGYTAHHPESEIGSTIARGKLFMGQRFAVRYSNWPTIDGTVIVDTKEDAPPDAVVCPAQTGRTASCATCALCWGSDRLIAFLRH